MTTATEGSKPQGPNSISIDNRTTRREFYHVSLNLRTRSLIFTSNLTSLLSSIIMFIYNWVTWSHNEKNVWPGTKSIAQRHFFWRTAVFCVAQIDLKTSRLAFNKVDKRPILAFNLNRLCVITPKSVPHLVCNYNRFAENSRNSQTETVINE